MTSPTMKRIGVLLVGALAFATSSASEDKSGSVSIDELRVPASPAFILLEVSPTSVERPNTPRAFALSILSATESSNNFPQDLALEIAPYWWRSRPNVTFESYYGLGNQKKKIGTTIAQTLAISLATTDLEERVGIDGTRVGLGVRFMLLRGGPDPALRQKVEEAVESLKAIQVKLLENCVPDDPEAPDSEPDPVCIAELEPKLRKAGQEVTREVKKMSRERQGWAVEFATALTADFPDNDTEKLEINRVGAWVTASYNARKPKSLTFVGVGRFFREDMLTEHVSRSDLGARLIWKADSNAMPPIGLSVEYVRRFTSGCADTERLMAVLEYRLPLDNISVVASYGKTFDNSLVGQEDLVSALGINFGFGRGPVVWP